MNARASLVATLVLFGATTVAFSAPKKEDLERAGRRLGQVASQEGLEGADARHAITVLEQLVAAGLPVSHALDVVTAALERKLSREDVAALGHGVQAAYGRGASARELVNLTHDLAESGLPMNGILVAIDAVGRLAEDGLTDAETRRGVALRVLEGLSGGKRGKDLAQTIHDDARQDAESGEAGNGHGGQGHGKGGAAGDKQKDKIPPDLRDDRRGTQPPGGPSKGKPGGK